MSPRTLLFVVLLLSVVVAILHMAAISFSLYWTFLWFDVLMHFLGGITLSLLVAWWLFFTPLTKIRGRARFKLFLAAVFSPLFVGGLWEVFEYIAGVSFSVEGYPLDTFFDLVINLCGGGTAYLFLRVSRVLKHDYSYAA